MSHDDNLVIQCKDGCTTIIRRGGYETHNLADTEQVGRAASRLCRVSSRHPWVFVKKWAVYGATIILLLTLNSILSGFNGRNETLDLMRRAHGRYMILDYANARADLRLILKRDPSNVAARESLASMDGAGNSDCASTDQ